MSTSDANIRIGSLVRRVIAISAAFAAAMSLAALLAGYTDYIASIVAGSAIAIAGFLALAFTVRRSLQGSHGSLSNAAVAVIAILKLVVLGAVLWWLMSMGLIDPLIFLGGFSSVVVALIIEGLRMGRGA